MRILYLGSHSVLEYDQVKLWTDLGHDVFSIGAYTDPAHPGDNKRPPIDAPFHEDLAALAHATRVKHEAEPVNWAIDWAKADLHPSLIDWAEAIIVDCFPVQWVAAQWNRLSHKRVIWRTIGQSHPDIEDEMRRLKGLQIVRYSPAEQRFYEKIGHWAGSDALIRFGKDPADWYGWTGSEAVVGNLSQHNTDNGRDAWLNWAFFEQATKGLPVSIAGTNSEHKGGLGSLDYDAMRAYLRRIRVMLYTGTQPASYTLGLIEATMTGTPVVSIGPERMWMPDLFEGSDILGEAFDRPDDAHKLLSGILEWPDQWRQFQSDGQREAAIAMFGVETIGAQWADVLGRVAVPA